MVEWWVDETWVWALWRVQYHLQFTSCGPKVVLSEEGALRLRMVERGVAATQRLARGALGRQRWLAFTQELAACAAVGARRVLCVWCFACGALHVVAAVTGPCCLSDSLLCLCLRCHFAAAATARRHHGDERAAVDGWIDGLSAGE
eukprot:COSAG06_NODE_4351_length_4337_cov_48.628126_4_plen_146_part_00